MQKEQMSSLYQVMQRELTCFLLTNSLQIFIAKTINQVKAPKFGFLRITISFMLVLFSIHILMSVPLKFPNVVSMHLYPGHEQVSMHVIVDRQGFFDWHSFPICKN